MLLWCIALRDDDLAELASRPCHHDHICRLTSGGGVRGGVVRQGAAHADRLVIRMGMHRHKEEVPCVVHPCIVRVGSARRAGRLPYR